MINFICFCLVLLLTDALAFLIMSVLIMEEEGGDYERDDNRSC